MGDETTKIVLNAVGTADDIDDKMKAFLDYVAGKKTDDEYVKKLDQAVKKAKMNKRLRRDYMTLYQHDLEIEDQALKKGIKQGIEQGIEQGREEGRAEGVRSMITDMLKMGKTPEAIAEFCGCSLDLIKEIQSNM